MAKTIMAVGAHTGDAQLTCGMLLAKHAMQGDRVVIVDLTAGERGTPAGWTTPDFRKYNVECAAKFAEKIGGESIVLDTPDGELYDSKEPGAGAGGADASISGQRRSVPLEEQHAQGSYRRQPASPTTRFSSPRCPPLSTSFPGRLSPNFSTQKTGRMPTASSPTIILM